MRTFCDTLCSDNSLKILFRTDPFLCGAPLWWKRAWIISVIWFVNFIVLKKSWGPFIVYLFMLFTKVTINYLPLLQTLEFLLKIFLPNQMEKIWSHVLDVFKKRQPDIWEVRESARSRSRRLPLRPGLSNPITSATRHCGRGSTIRLGCRTCSHKCLCWLFLRILWTFPSRCFS